ncbi:sensor histidine kinase [Dinghuibacter silviterrae]|uniref:Histidine kinase n=1 Tax=Dinghuibacter silviterrae TaxID=1539049 RepID=A0A4R8DPK4_9BACT|nr:histidine kinase [Dinghuibacter silviterrae]TDW99050.1 histidine kinase [Dinghuibacter silviterrae]
MRRNPVRYIIQVIIHVLFWTGVYYTLKALTTTSFGMVLRNGDRGTQKVDIQLSFPYSWIVLGFLIVLFYTNTLWLFKQVLRYKSAAGRVAVIASWCILLFTINFLVIRWRINVDNAPYIISHQQFSGGKDSLPKMTFNSALPSAKLPDLPSPPDVPVSPVDNWLHMQLVIALIFLSVLAVAIAQFFIKEWIRNDLTRTQAEAQQLSTEIKFLRSQVNPHFLFNTLNNLFSMAQKKGNDELADGISKLSGMMRYMIYESNTEQVYLQKEIEYLKNCIALHKLRYAGGEVEVAFSYPPPGAIGEVQIAPMLFIPFLENAFKHGIAIGERSCITVTITAGAGKLNFTCENTDHSHVRRLEEEKTGIGLANVRRRLELVYPGRYALYAGPKDGKYLVHLQIAYS